MDAGFPEHVDHDFSLVPVRPHQRGAAGIVPAAGIGAAAEQKLHGGDLVMESALGQGTRVIARFPAARSETNRSSPEEVP